MSERDTLFRQALELANEDSVRIWLIDKKAFIPMQSNVQVASDLAGGVAYAQMWPYSLRFDGVEGGTLDWAQPDVLVGSESWNPIGGSGQIYDRSIYTAISDYGTLPDPYTGLHLPQRIQIANITAQTGLPISKTLDWVTLSFAGTISVPTDAWSDWDASTQTFITAGTKYPGGATARVKCTVTYPADLFSTVTWHDGSPLSMADFVMNMIMTFDRAKSASTIYDDSAVPNYDAFMSSFKGVKIVSINPLVIETYSDNFQLDAENNVTTWWPQYSQGPGAWHMLAVSNLAEANGDLAYTPAKADGNSIEWMNYIDGASLAILDGHLDDAIASSLIPYSATLGTYITTGDADARYANLKSWYTTYDHFWVGTGPYYLYDASYVNNTVTLKHNAAFVDLSDKWSGSSEPMIPEVDVSGPASITVGQPATYTVSVTYNGLPYPTGDIEQIKYFLIDSVAGVVETGNAVAVKDIQAAAAGVYQVVLSGTSTSKLTSGSGRIEVAVTTKTVTIPAFDEQVIVDSATPSFTDVPSNHWAWILIERLYNAGITGGCGTGLYCPDAPVTRAQMAVFLERGMKFSTYIPKNVAPTFTDTVGHWAEDWIEALKNGSITSGCGTGLYCPEAPVTRAQMAVFLLKAKYGSTYKPPAVGASTGFADIPTNHWAAAWIKQLAAESITSGCGSGNYCPEASVTRAQMAVFLVKTFGLP